MAKSKRMEWLNDLDVRMRGLNGRRKPYTAIGVRRLKCVRCGEPAVHQWQICSDGNLYRPICNECDAGLNELAMQYVFGRTREADLKAYRQRLGLVEREAR